MLSLILYLDESMKVHIASELYSFTFVAVYLSKDRLFASSKRLLVSDCEYFPSIIDDEKVGNTLLYMHKVDGGSSVKD